MPLPVYDIETDEMCRLMDLAEFGAYMRLLIRQWIEGSIPADPIKIARLLGGNTKETERLLSGFLNAKFPADAANSRRRNPELSALHAEKSSVAKKNREIANKRWESERSCERTSDGMSERIADGNANALIRASDSESESESFSGISLRDGGPGEGQSFHDARYARSGRWPAHLLGSLVSEYPRHRRTGKVSATAAADRALTRIAAGENPPADPIAWLRERIRAFAASAAGNNGQFTPKPSTWFDDERYLDPPEAWENTPGQTWPSEKSTAELLAEDKARRARL